ncbi:MAG TPA: hypothetical protein VFI84_03285 [Candidatus Saccharimonadales bacterium]|nr:hypothetical protein [Candidatus Saccharimonadales bacterium]
MFSKNTNNLVGDLQQGVGEASYHFQEKYVVGRAPLLFAVGYAIGVLARRGFQRWQDHKEQQLNQEIEQLFTQADNTPNTPNADAA